MLKPGRFASAASAVVCSLRVVTFNVLAPSLRVCKPLSEVPWRTRQEHCCSAIRTMDADIVALQEWDFRTEGFTQLYLDHFEQDYEVFTFRRTGGKKDGLGLLLRRDCFRDVAVSNVALQPSSCDRVAMVAQMRHVASGRRINLVNTHLTVAHTGNGWDIPTNRPRQMEQILQRLASLNPSEEGGAGKVASGHGTHVAVDKAGAAAGAAEETEEEDAAVTLLCGDMNADHLETDAPKLPFGCPAVFTTEQVAAPVHMALATGLSSALHDSPSMWLLDDNGNDDDDDGAGQKAAAAADETQQQEHQGTAAVRGRRVKRAISHTSSYGTGHDGCVDYIFYGATKRSSGGSSSSITTSVGGSHDGAHVCDSRGVVPPTTTTTTTMTTNEVVVQLREAFLYPPEVAPETAWSAESAWGGGDHGMLSDHRPLVADFTLAPTTATSTATATAISPVTATVNTAKAANAKLLHHGLHRHHADQQPMEQQQQQQQQQQTSEQLQ